ncbi:hypothetical protein [Amycolatopsis sp. cmx-4-68]|uniref:hypothetical protein n=1 Tax=Amycolatopsis sp. cmx-4-68 TaxID=2790938 RepID=UPI00397C8989
MPFSPVAALFESYRPGASIESLAAAADVPARDLRAWLTPEVAGRLAAPPSEGTLVRLATALGAELSTVRKAFTAVLSNLNGGYWSHFAPGDRVLVFGEPDPATGWSPVRRGAVTDVSPEGISVDFGTAGEAVFTAADRIRISHGAGACRCVVALP